MMRTTHLPRGVGKRYAMIAGLLIALFLVLFVVVEVWRPSLLIDPSPRMKHAGWPTALLGVGLLTVDAVLPVPASLVMIAHGAVFGVVVGTLLSMVGSTGATLLGFTIGRRGGRFMARFVSSGERMAADRMIARWGMLAIIASRPVPLLAETVAVIAGTSPMSWGRVTLAAVIGAFAPSLLYAIAGAAAVDFQSGALVFAAAILLSGAAWFLGQRFEWRTSGGSARKLATEPRSDASGTGLVDGD